MVHDPTTDAARLDATLSRADSIVVVEGHAYDSRNRKNNKVLARSSDPERVASAISAIVPDFGQPRMDWMTPGGPTIAFLSNRELLAAVTCINPDWVRCDVLWDGDAPLNNGGTALLDVLVACATSTVKGRLQAAEPSDAIAKDVRWKFDLPPMRVSLAMKRGGLTMAEAHAAARSTMSAEELASHIKLNDEFWDAMESAAVEDQRSGEAGQ